MLRHWTYSLLFFYYFYYYYYYFLLWSLSLRHHSRHPNVFGCDKNIHYNLSVLLNDINVSIYVTCDAYVSVVSNKVHLMLRKFGSKTQCSPFLWCWNAQYKNNKHDSYFCVLIAIIVVDVCCLHINKASQAQRNSMRFVTHSASTFIQYFETDNRAVDIQSNQRTIL